MEYHDKPYISADQYNALTLLKYSAGAKTYIGYLAEVTTRHPYVSVMYSNMKEALLTATGDIKEQIINILNMKESTYYED